MTAPKRNSTLQSRFGFNDSDIKTPKHDELMIWLDENVQHFVERSGPFIVQKDFDHYLMDIQKTLPRMVEEFRGETQKTREHWNQQAVNDTDLYIQLRRQQEERNQKTLDGLQRDLELLDAPPPIRLKRLTRKQWESTITTGKDYIVGFVDMLVIAEWGVPHIDKGEWIEQYHYETYLFEVKTSIPSAGELIRQIRMYQQYKRGEYVIVSQDTRFAEVIKGQGIHFFGVDMDRGNHQVWWVDR